MEKSKQQPKDIESLSLAELRALAEEEAKNAVQKQQVQPSKTRDEQGRFVADNTVDEGAGEVADENEAEDNGSKVFRRVIDIGDGAGPEVFEAETLEALVDKIADAKQHATKKIRQQEEELRTLRAEKEEAASKERQFSADEEFVYSQELLSKPTQAFKKLFKDMTGVSIEEFSTVKQRMDAMSQAQANTDAISTFITSHPDYEDSPKNSAAMKLAMQGKPVTSEELHKAYLTLKESGLLEVKAEEADGGQEEERQTEERIAAPVVPTTPSQRTRKASGLSTRTRPSAVPRNTEPTEDDLYNMPLDKLRSMANQSLTRR